MSKSSDFSINKTKLTKRTSERWFTDANYKLSTDVNAGIGWSEVGVCIEYYW